MEDTVTMKILTLNLHKGFTFMNRRFVLHELREAVRSVGADLVFLQEVIGLHEDHASRYEHWPAAPQYEFLADTLWSSYAYGRNAVYPAGHHGNALLSKYPILSHRNVDVSAGELESRGLLHCVLQQPERGVEVHAICVHLGLREAWRQQQIDTLCALLRHEVPPDAPLVIAGDFNDWRGLGHRRLLRDCFGLEEVFDAAYGRLARSFPARWPLLSLDRIYVRNLRWSAPNVLSSRPWSHLSDHAGLVVQLDFCT